MQKLFYSVFFLKILASLAAYVDIGHQRKIDSEENETNYILSMYNPEDDFHSSEEMPELNDELEDEYELNYKLPLLSRTKRRIFPGVGKALDRDRSSRNPWVRTRDGFDGRERGASVVTRDGPMGSDLLYALYPDLAPANWEDRVHHGQEHGSTGQEHFTNEEAFPDEEFPDEIYEQPETTHFQEKPKKRERDVPVSDINRRSKGRISKKLKEEIAVFAEEHGITAAIAYFRDKVNVNLRKKAIEKFIKRYRKRRERQRIRRLSKS